MTAATATSVTGPRLQLNRMISVFLPCGRLLWKPIAADLLNPLTHRGVAEWVRRLWFGTSGAADRGAAWPYTAWPDAASGESRDAVSAGGGVGAGLGDGVLAGVLQKPEFGDPDAGL